MLALSFLLPFFSFLFISVRAFTFTTSTLSECDELTVQWEGGTGPFLLLFIPVFGTPRNVSIPSTAVTGGRGSFSTPVTFPAGQRLVLTMSDSTGFGAGGTTDVLTVEPSKGGSCDSSEESVAFPFQLNQALQQCRPFTFEGYDRAVQPVTISMVIPGGQSVVVSPPAGRPSYSWIANVAAGTSMIFMMTDARGAQGGASDIRIVGASDDSSCISGNSPSSTLAPTSSSTSTTSSTSSTTSTDAPGASSSATTGSQSSTSTPISAIAGTVIGSLLFLAVIVTLGLFFLKNLKKKADRKKQQATDFHHSGRKPSVANFYGNPSPYGSPNPQYPYSPNTAAPFNNPFSDSTSNISPAEPNAQYAYQQQSDPFHNSRPYYPPPPLVPPAQDPFNPTESSTLPPPTDYSMSIPPNEADAGRPAPVRELPSSQFKPVNDEGFNPPPTQYNERRRGPSRGLSVTNPDRGDKSPGLPSSNPSPFA